MPKTTTRAPALVKPAYLWTPDHDTTAAAVEVTELAASAGLMLDAEQKLVLEVMLAERAGKWAALEFAIIAARQNLKTALLQAAALGDLYLFDVPLVVWTAHLFSTTQEAMRDITALIEGTPDLDRGVRKISTANGEEYIELLGGQRLIFRARQSTSGRGLSGDVVVLDEAFALTSAMMGSLMPTMSARPNPQIRYASSAGHGGSAVLRRVRDRGRAGGAPTLAYVEWCAPDGGCATDDCMHLVGTEGCALDKVENWQRANTTLGKRISVEYVAGERLGMPEAEFARERLGWWDEPSGDEEQVLPLDVWARLADPESQIEGSFVYALDAPPDRSTAYIAVSGARADGLTHVELAVEPKRGTDWAVAWLVERRKQATVVVDEKRAAGALIADLVKAGVRVRKVNTQDMVKACGRFYDQVTDTGDLRHLDQQLLNDAVGNARKRSLGGAFAWDGTGIGALNAATLAVWGHRTIKRTYKSKGF